MTNTINLIELAKECPDVTINVRLGDLVTANKELAAETVRNLEKRISDAAAETYPSVDKVAEMLSVSKPTLWRWEKIGYLKPVRIGGKVRYKMSEVKKLLEERSEQ